MSAWLAEHPDGGTVKHAYAEAARRAWELDHTNPTDANSPRDRERRPVLVLARELRECLTRLTLRLESDPPPAVEGLPEDLMTIARLLTVPPLRAQRYGTEQPRLGQAPPSLEGRGSGG